MSNVIDFLQRIGEDAELRHAAPDMLAQALREAGIDPALKAAILGTDQRELEALLGAVPNVCCAIYKEDEEEEEESEEDDEDEDDEERKKKDE